MPLVASLQATPTLWCVHVPLVYAVPSALTRLMPAGAVLSMLTDSEVVALLPTLSVQVPVAACAAPSAEIVTEGLTEATPEPVSVQLNVTVTGALYQPFALGDRSGVALINGAVVSTTVTVNVLVEEFPRASLEPQVTVVAPSA